MITAAHRVGDALSLLGVGLYGLRFVLPVHTGVPGVMAFVVALVSIVAGGYLAAAALWSPNALLWACLILGRRPKDPWAVLCGLIAVVMSLVGPSAAGFQFYRSRGNAGSGDKRLLSAVRDTHRWAPLRASTTIPVPAGQLE